MTGRSIFPCPYWLEKVAGISRNLSFLEERGGSERHVPQKECKFRPALVLGPRFYPFRIEVKAMRVVRLPLFVLGLIFFCGCLPSYAQCPGGFTATEKPLYGEGDSRHNFAEYREVLLPVNVRIDRSYHQPALGRVANGQSDARSRLVVSEVPAGLYIIPGGDDRANHGWAVGDGPEPRIQLAPAAWDYATNTITQYKFGMRLYCTTGSSVVDATTGGCNVKVTVCYKPLP
jgi:hypothetical protein